MNPNYSADVYKNKGQVLFQLNQYEKSIECFNKAIDLLDQNDCSDLNDLKKLVLDKMKSDPNYINARLLKRCIVRGNVFRKLKRNKDAVECFSKAIEIDATNKKATIALKELLIIDLKALNIAKSNDIKIEPKTISNNELVKEKKTNVSSLCIII